MKAHSLIRKDFLKILERKLENLKNVLTIFFFFICIVVMIESAMRYSFMIHIPLSVSRRQFFKIFY